MEWDESPYFLNVECDFTSPVYETSCRSVSENNNIVWPIDECIGIQFSDNTTTATSWMYTCDENDNLWQVYYDSFDCTGNSYTTTPTRVTGHGCDRSTPCNTAG